VIRRSSLRGSVREVTAPVALAVDPDVALAELGLGVSEMGRITRLISQATDLAEAYTNRAFITRTFTLTLDQFPTGQLPWWDGVRDGTVRAFAGDGIITIPKPPLVAIDSVQYFTLANTFLTVDPSTYYVDASSEPARVVLNYGQLWPVDTRDRAAVVVTYTAGYGNSAAAMPPAIEAGILAHVRDTVQRPNSFVSAERIDNASVNYGTPTSVAGGFSGNLSGGLRADAAQILAPLRILESGL
jgi:hypothetical protein